MFSVVFVVFVFYTIVSCASQLHKNYSVKRQTKTMVARLLDSTLTVKQTYKVETGIKRDYDVCSICLVRKSLFVLNSDAVCSEDACMLATYSVFWYGAGATE